MDASQGGKGPPEDQGGGSNRLLVGQAGGGSLSLAREPLAGEGQRQGVGAGQQGQQRGSPVRPGRRQGGRARKGGAHTTQQTC